METDVTIQALQQMKRDGRKIVGVVAWDYQVARIAERAGADIVSVGDSVGVNLWGRDDPDDVTMDEMVLVCRAVRRGVERALVSCDFPFGPLQEGPDSAVRAARRLVDEAGADLIKLDDAAHHPEAVAAVVAAGIPVFAQFEITAQVAERYGLGYRDIATALEVPALLRDEMVATARRFEESGAALIDFKNSGPVVGPAVSGAVAIPVIGGFGGGPWLDGRMRMIHAAIGYAASTLDSNAESYARVADVTLAAATEYAADVRAGRQIKGAPRVQP